MAPTASQKTSDDKKEGGNQRSAAQGGSCETGSGGPRYPGPTSLQTKIERMEEAIEHLIQVLDDRKKRTVNDSTRALAHKVKSAFVSIKRELQGRKTNSKLAPVNHRVQQLNSIRKELFQTPGGTVWMSPLQNTPKRKERSPLSTDEAQVTKKASLGGKAAPVVAQLPGEEQTQKEKPQKKHEEMKWTQVTGKKKREKEKRRNPPKQRKNKTLPKALLISANDNASYADILKKVKEGLREHELEDTIDKVRRTNNDKLLIVLDRKSGDKLEPLQRKVASVLGNEAEVSGRSQEIELSIRDLEETTTEDDVKVALQKAAGSDIVVPRNWIRALRPAYKGTQIASVKLPEEVARKVMGERGRIRIGLVNCPIKEVDRPRKCFKCWNSGHIAINCPSQIDRSSLCLKCGQAGHKIVQCANDPHCPLCAERDKNSHHIVGSYKCATNLWPSTTKTKTRGNPKPGNPKDGNENTTAQSKSL